MLALTGATSLHKDVNIMHKSKYLAIRATGPPGTLTVRGVAGSLGRRQRVINSPFLFALRFCLFLVAMVALLPLSTARLPILLVAMIAYLPAFSTGLPSFFLTVVILIFPFILPLPLYVALSDPDYMKFQP